MNDVSGTVTTEEAGGGAPLDADPRQPMQQSGQILPPLSSESGAGCPTELWQRAGSTTVADSAAAWAAAKVASRFVSAIA